jgi:ABC-type phosphate transport system permease subunit
VGVDSKQGNEKMSITAKIFETAICTVIGLLIMVPFPLALGWAVFVDLH